MKKTVPLNKELSFKSNLAQIISIALDHDFKLEERTVKGNLIISGSYKMNDVSVNTEEFNFEIPVNIELSDKYILDNLNVSVDDFYYEILNNNVLLVNIEIGLDNLEEKEEVINPIKYEPEIVKEVDKMDNEERMDIKEVKTLFDSLDDASETYSMYRVYIVKENDNVESIVLNYGITSEMLAEYNDLSDIKIGDKLIIPSVFNETN